MSQVHSTTTFEDDDDDDEEEEISDLDVMGALGWLVVVPTYIVRTRDS